MIILNYYLFDHKKQHKTIIAILYVNFFFVNIKYNKFLNMLYFIKSFLTSTIFLTFKLYIIHNTKLLYYDSLMTFSQLGRVK